MAASEGAQELQDLVQFLRSPRADVSANRPLHARRHLAQCFCWSI